MCQLDLLLLLENVLVMWRFGMFGLKSSTVTEASSFTPCITNELRLSARPSTCVCFGARVNSRYTEVEHSTHKQLGVFHCNERSNDLHKKEDEGRNCKAAVQQGNHAAWCGGDITRRERQTKPTSYFATHEEHSFE